MKNYIDEVFPIILILIVMAFFIWISSLQKKSEAKPKPPVSALEEIEQEKVIPGAPKMKKPDKDPKRKQGSFVDFVANEWDHIIKWECNVRKGKYYPTYLKYNNEFNFCGLSQHAHMDFYIDLIHEVFSTTPNFNGKVCIDNPFPKVKEIYYNQYFKPVKNLNKCLRLSTFDQQVLSGKGIKILQKSLGLPPDGIIGPVTLFNAKPQLSNLSKDHEEFINYLKRTTHKGKSLWDHYKNGWTNRVNDTFEKSKQHCQ